MNTCYKICFIGLGSIGQRHFRNVVSVLNERNVRYTIDAVRRADSKELPGDISACLDSIVYDAKDLDDSYDIIFITNPTYLHFDILKTVYDKARAFFIEKPVFASSETDIRDFCSEDKLIYVACPLRHTRLFQYVKDNIDPDSVISVRSISSSYLPAWRSNSDYRTSYSASKEKGGGVSLDVIHEWDYLTALFGFPERTYSIIDKLSDLEISSDDIAIYIGKKQNMTFELHLDYFSKETSRNFSMITNDEVITADFVEKTLTRNPGNHVLTFPEDGNAPYVTELKFFFDMIEHKTDNINDMNHAVKVLALAEGKL